MATPPKNESAPAAAAATAAAAAAAAPAPAAPAGKSLLSTLLPVVLVVVLAPAVSWLVMQYVMLPQLEKRLGAAAGGAPAAAQEEKAAAAAPAPAKGGHGAKKGEAPVASAPNTYEFSNVIVNLAGTMGTRYLKTTFLVTGSDQKLNDTFTGNKAKLVDITLNVLSSLTLAELEEAGAKNIIREKLVNAYNTALGHKVVEQIYFSDFVVQ
jgi:flagellar FliL protein